MSRAVERFSTMKTMTLSGRNTEVDELRSQWNVATWRQCVDLSFSGVLL